MKRSRRTTGTIVTYGFSPSLLFVCCILREKCPNTEFFLVSIFLYSDWHKFFHGWTFRFIFCYTVIVHRECSQSNNIPQTHLNHVSEISLIQNPISRKIKNIRNILRKINTQSFLESVTCLQAPINYFHKRETRSIFFTLTWNAWKMWWKSLGYDWSWKSYGVQFSTFVLNSNFLQDHFYNLFEMSKKILRGRDVFLTFL